MMPAQSQRCISMLLGTRGPGECGDRRCLAGRDLRNGVPECEFICCSWGQLRWH
jgi:hypothetical protein